MNSLYFHFPFCETKCHYCDFYSLAADRTKVSDRLDFQNALKIECELRAPEIESVVDFIFMGGGTPSMTDPEVMRTALEPLSLHARLASDYEWTMEANPSSVDLERLKAYRDFGVNRISMGVQSLDDAVLKKMGRVHDRDAAFRALDAIFEAGFRNVSVDLLCGVPGQTIDDLEKAMKELTSYPITHLSCYLLTLHKFHRMFPDLPYEDTQLEHLLAIDRFMSAHGFDHYEISNFCKPGKQARHNMNTWKGLGYLGFGPSAHSFDHTTQTRWKNVSSIGMYAEKLKNRKLPTEQSEILSDEAREIEKWMLALRLADGFPEAWLETPLQKSRATQLISEGMLEKHPSAIHTFRLTPRGFSVSDSIVAGFIS